MVVCNICTFATESFKGFKIHVKKQHHLPFADYCKMFSYNPMRCSTACSFVGSSSESLDRHRQSCSGYCAKAPTDKNDGVDEEHADDKAAETESPWIKLFSVPASYLGINLRIQHRPVEEGLKVIRVVEPANILEILNKVDALAYMPDYGTLGSLVFALHVWFIDQLAGGHEARTSPKGFHLFFRSLIDIASPEPAICSFLSANAGRTFKTKNEFFDCVMTWQASARLDLLLLKPDIVGQYYHSIEKKAKEFYQAVTVEGYPCDAALESVFVEPGQVTFTKEFVLHHLPKLQGDANAGDANAKVQYVLIGGWIRYVTNLSVMGEAFDQDELKEAVFAMIANYCDHSVILPVLESLNANISVKGWTLE